MKPLFLIALVIYFTGCSSVRVNETLAPTSQCSILEQTATYWYKCLYSKNIDEVSELAILEECEKKSLESRDQFNKMCQ